MTAQFYLIYSSEIPADLWLLREDESTFGDKDFNGKIEEDFGQTLVPLGTDLTKAEVKVPEGTKFAGVLWGDGEHFEEYQDPTWGILGEIERIGMNDYRIRGVDGAVVLDSSQIEDEGQEIRHIMPPEAFGLQRKPWWEEVFPWCND